MFERNHSFFHHCLLSCVTRCFKNSTLRKPKWGAQAVVRGHGPLGPLEQRHWTKLIYSLKNTLRWTYFIEIT